jgi:hypothetical protein
MQITIDLPDLLVNRVKDHWGDLSDKIINQLVLEAFLEGLIDFDEFKEMLGLENNADLKTFLSANIPQHPSGLLNLAGSCADIDLKIDDKGISDERNQELIKA